MYAKRKLMTPFSHQVSVCCLLTSFCCLIGCPNSKHKADILAHMRSTEVIKQFELLFPDGIHHVSRLYDKYPFWSSRIDLYSRYQFSLNMNLELDDSGHRVELFNEPEFYIEEIKHVTFYDGKPDGGCTYTDNQLRFGLDRWKDLVQAEGDFSVLGYEIVKDNPVRGFDDFCRTTHRTGTRFGSPPEQFPAVPQRAPSDKRMHSLRGDDDSPYDIGNTQVNLCVGYDHVHCVIWLKATDSLAVNSQGKGPSTFKYNYHGTFQFHNGREIEWRCVTLSGKDGRATINCQKFKMSSGAVFLISVNGSIIETKQLNRDLSQWKPTEAFMRQIASHDTEIAAFVGAIANDNVVTVPAQFLEE